jgi:hypothetical protein
VYICGVSYYRWARRVQSEGVPVVSYEKALDLLSRDDRFKATIYAMNTLLVHKGIYTQEEFERLFVEWASKQGRNSSNEISREAGVSV